MIAGFLVGLLQGLILGIVLMMVIRRVRHPRPAKPICGCTHHLSFHAGAGACNFPLGGFSERTCGCRRYIQQDTTAAVALYERELMS